MISREAKVWGVATLMSLIIHGALLWEARVQARDAGSGVQAQKVTRLRFQSAASAVPTSAVVEQPRPQPVRQPPSPPRPAQRAARSVVEKPPEPVDAPVQETPPAVALLEQGGAPQAGEILEGVESMAALRRAYEQKLMAHIETHKFYPPTARRRHVEGKVHVSFMVTDGGGVAQLRCSRGADVLQGAACAAVEAARPLPLPPPEMRVPLPVMFAMEFALDVKR